MVIVSSYAEYQALPQNKWHSANIVDVVLRDQTYLLGVRELNGKAFGCAVGGHTGAIEFYRAKELHNRSIEHVFKVAGIYALPVVGRILRVRRIRRWGGKRPALSNPF